jgi:uncharacterized protein YjiK
MKLWINLLPLVLIIGIWSCGTETSQRSVATNAPLSQENALETDADTAPSPTFMPADLAATAGFNYDLSKPSVYKMPSVLDEISGIAFMNGKNDTVYAVQDEIGEVFAFSLKDKTVKTNIFSQKGDYEDLAFLNNQLVILKSNGALVSFAAANFLKTGKAADLQETKGLLPEGEYEGLYADETSQTLFVLSKETKEAKRNRQIFGYALKMAPNGKISFGSAFTIDVSAIEAKITIKKNNFLPSALAKNKKTNEWFILSAHNSVLVVTNANWKVKQAFSLPENLFEQPEGIAFDSQHNLYISNEKGKAKEATILKFAYQK